MIICNSTLYRRRISLFVVVFCFPWCLRPFVTTFCGNKSGGRKFIFFILTFHFPQYINSVFTVIYRNTLEGFTIFLLLVIYIYQWFCLFLVIIFICRLKGHKMAILPPFPCLLILCEYLDIISSRGGKILFFRISCYRL